MQPTTKTTFCCPPPGKSGPNATRVPQSPQKGDTCIYYAFQILRNEHKIGKNPTEVQLKEREIECLISTCRKEVTKIDNTLKLHWLSATQITESLGLKTCTRSQAQDYLKNNMHDVLPEHKELVRTAIETFCAQETFDDFVLFTDAIYNATRRALQENCLHRLGFSDEKIQKSVAESTDDQIQWGRFNWFQQCLHISNVMAPALASAYGCTYSSWHPEQPVENLYEQLETHGPLFLIGHFGQQYYETPATDRKISIEGRATFGWPANAKRKEEMTDHHAVVIVGATIKPDQSLVYFLDPLDGSSDLTTQKVYAMSYKRLLLSTCNLYGMRMQSKSTGNPAYTSQKQGENIYAVYKENKETP